MEKYDIVVNNGDEILFGFAEKCHNISSDTSFLFQSFRIIRITFGEAKWKVGNEVYLLKKDDIILFNNFEARKITEIITAPFKYDLIGFSPSNILQSDLMDMFYKSDRKLTNNPSIDFCINEIIVEIKNNNKYKIKCIKQLINLTLLYIARTFGYTQQNSGTDVMPQSVIVKAVQYINNNLEQDLSVATLAKTTGYSNEHFSRLFRKFTGVAVKKYIATARIENAISLMNEKNITVIDAAFKSGFNSSSGFYKAFKTFSEHTPSHHTNRNNIGNKN